MKITYAVVLCVLVLLVSACAQKVNDPADVQAIKKACDDYLKAVNAKDAKAVAALMTDKTVDYEQNGPTLIGKEAIQKQVEGLFDEFEPQLGMRVSDVQVAGDLGVAHGTWTLKMMPRAMGLASSNNGGGWTLVFKRQGDGSWKWDSGIANSDRPLPGTTADGAEEKALIQIEQDWARALEKSDVAAVEKYLAKEWTYNADGQVMNRAQMLAEMRGGAYKIESAQMTELHPHVFGDVAVVRMTAIMKGKYKGADFPSPVRSTDFFVKRDGQWQAVSTQNVTIK